VSGDDVVQHGDDMTRELDPNVNSKLRRFAELEVERQSASIDRMLDQHIADFKWLTASLLLLNSGGSAAILNSASISNQGKLISASLYLAGIALALLIGVASQKFAIKTLSPTIAYRAFWIAISQGEVFDPELERQAIENIQVTAKRAWIVPALGWLSALAFLAGSICAAMHLVELPNGSSRDRQALADK
jgi:hypothetical protein